MTAMFKALILATPVLAIVLWYTVVKMEKQEVQMEQHNVEFQKKQDDFNQEFEAFLNPKKETALYAKREKERKEREERLKREAEELKTKRAEADRRDKEYVESFEKALQEFEVEQKRKEGAE